MSVSLLFCICVCAACSSARKTSLLRRNPSRASLSLSSRSVPVSVADLDSMKARVDTLRVVDIDGKEMFLMGAIRDDNGNMVANQVLEASVVVARFRNVAERNGKVDLRFQIIVPPSLRDRQWQLQYTPTMFVMGDSVRLEKLLVTGELFRRRQIRGYQQYNRFLRSIITDTTAFVDYRALELFISRNIPELYAFRSDSSYVDDTTFFSAFGVNAREALEHYTDMLSKRYHARRLSRSDMKFRQMVKAPIITSGIRLDTVMLDSDGNYVYDYVQTVKTHPQMRKVDIVLDGEIHDRDMCIHRIARSEPLTFFISSLSALVDPTPRHITKIVERSVRADANFNIDFPQGGSAVLRDFSDNARELSRVEEKIREVKEDDIFNVDSVAVVASSSPEGSWKYNASLSRRRAAGIAEYFAPLMKLRPRSIGENWDYLERLVEMDSTLTITQKEEYAALCTQKDPDLREKSMTGEPWYGHLKNVLYPKLRRVQFQFYLSRRNMLKDTIHTSVEDSVYSAGLRAIRDRDYEKALEILTPYADYNTAVAYTALERNASAMAILRRCPVSARREYLMAVLWSRKKEYQKAVQCYLDACRMDSQYIHRGNLDPEISELINRYSLNLYQ